MDALSLFRGWLRDEGKTPNTTDSYVIDAGKFQGYVRSLPQAMDWPAAAQRDVILAYDEHLRQQGAKSNTIARRHAGLNAFFTCLVDNGIITENPIRSIPRPKAPTAPRIILTEEQVHRVLIEPTAADKPRVVRNKVLLWLIYDIGLEIGKLLELPVTAYRESLDGSISLLVPAYDGKTHWVRLSDDVAVFFKAYLVARKFVKDRSPALLFFSTHSEQLTRQAVWTYAKKVGKQVGVPHVTLTMLSDSAVVHLANTNTLESIRERFGLAHVNTVLRIIDTSQHSP